MILSEKDASLVQKVDRWLARSVVVYGPAGCGKTRNAERIKSTFGLVGNECDMGLIEGGIYRVPNMRRIVREAGGPVLFTDCRFPFDAFSTPPPCVVMTYDFAMAAVARHAPVATLHRTRARAYLVAICDSETHAVIDAGIWSQPEWESSRYLDEPTYVAFAVNTFLPSGMEHHKAFTFAAKQMLEDFVRHWELLGERAPEKFRHRRLLPFLRDAFDGHGVEPHPTMKFNEDPRRNQA